MLVVDTKKKKFLEADSNAIVLDHNMAAIGSQLQTSNS